MKAFSTKKVLNFEVLLNELISVDGNDKFVSSIDKWKAHSNSYLASPIALPHRAFSIFLFNSRNELLLQKRSQDKRTFPLCWTNTCCSHPNMIKLGERIMEEPIRASLQRALHRQLRMDLTHSPFYFMGKFLYKQEGSKGKDDFGEFEVDYVYLNKLNSESLPFEKVASEVAEAKWISKHQINSFREQVLKEGGYFSPWFSKMMANGFLEKWWELIEQNKLEDVKGEDVETATNLG